MSAKCGGSWSMHDPVGTARRGFLFSFRFIGIQEPSYIIPEFSVRYEAHRVQAQPPRLQAQPTHILFELSDSPFHSQVAGGVPTRRFELPSGR